MPSKRSSAQRARALANQLGKTHSAKDHRRADELTELDPHVSSYGSYKWRPPEPHHFIGGLRSSFYEQPDLTSTLDTTAQEGLLTSCMR